MGKNVFFTKFSETSGVRIDPLYYKLDLKYDLKSIKLKTLLKDVFQGQAQGTESKNKIKILKVKNLDLFGNIDFINVSYIDSTSSNRILQYGDIITPFRGQTIFTNKFAIYNSSELCTIDNNLGVIRLNQELINPKYFLYFISSKIGFNEILKNLGGAGIPAITKDIIYNIDVYLPLLEIQDKIISIMDNTYNLKTQKEKEAKEKLASIDKYLLSELGIEFQEKEKENLEERVFSKKFSDLSGYRFDSNWQLDMKYSISGGKFENKSLIEIANISKGQSITSNQISKGNYPVIAGGKVSPYCHNVYNQNENVITVSASGAYSGYVWFHDYKFFASDCSVIRSKNEKNIMTLYIFEILKLKQDEIYNLQQGAGQPHVYPKDLAKLLIPLPSFDIQNKIVAHVQTLRDEAKILENDAKKIYENAKKEVEAIILKSDKNEGR